LWPEHRIGSTDARRATKVCGLDGPYIAVLYGGANLTWHDCFRAVANPKGNIHKNMAIDRA
jgi:hypothetical protein